MSTDTTFVVGLPSLPGRRIYVHAESFSDEQGIELWLGSPSPRTPLETRAAERPATW